MNGEISSGNLNCCIVGNCRKPLLAAKMVIELILDFSSISIECPTPDLMTINIDSNVYQFENELSASHLRTVLAVLGNAFSAVNAEFLGIEISCVEFISGGKSALYGFDAIFNLRNSLSDEVCLRCRIGMINTAQIQSLKLIRLC